MTDDTQPEAFDLADWLEAVGGGPSAKRCAALLREQHARIAELEAQLEAVGAGGVQALSAAPQQEAQEPCPTCAALDRTVMLDQVSFDRKPDCYGIRQITDDEAVEEWEDIRTSPDVAREEANDMMATGRGEIYEVVPLWTTPQPSPTAQADSFGSPELQAMILAKCVEKDRADSVLRDARRLCLCG